MMEMKKLSTALQLMQHIGLPVVQMPPKQAHGGKRASTTKAGPGRHHVAGHSKDSPRTSKGAPSGFVQHTASKAERDHRAVVALIGSRQDKRRNYLRHPGYALKHPEIAARYPGEK